MTKNVLEALTIVGIFAVVDVLAFDVVLPITVGYPYPANMLSILAGTVLLMSNIYALGVVLEGVFPEDKE